MELDNETSYSLYFHMNKINGKRYYGITCRDPELRWGKNGIGYMNCSKFWRAIQKYGWDNFEHEVCMTNLSKEEACAAEKYMIAEFNTQNDLFGYNIDEGGIAPKHTQETIEKIRKANLGKFVSEETRSKIREARLKQDFDYTPLVEYAKRQKGSHIPEERKAKIKEAQKKNFKTVKCIETNVVYESITDAARKIGIDKSGISTSCHSDGRLQTKGFHFCFI